MKPINGAAEAASGGRSSEHASFLDALKAIDVSSLDRLIAIGQEHTRINEFRAKAEGRTREESGARFAGVWAPPAARAPTHPPSAPGWAPAPRARKGAARASHPRRAAAHTGAPPP